MPEEIQMRIAPIPGEGRATNRSPKGTMERSGTPGSAMGVESTFTTNMIVNPSATKHREKLTIAVGAIRDVIIATSRITKNLIAGESIRIRCPVG